MVADQIINLKGSTSSINKPNSKNTLINKLKIVEKKIKMKP